MSARPLSLLLLASLAVPLAARDPLLPADVAYDAAVPEPSDVLGHEVGAWHARPDQIERALREVAEASPRVTLQEQGRTHEGRPLLLLAITSPENHARLEALRQAHVDAFRAGERSPLLVVWMGYSVHGNEPSGSNAALLLAYHLAAARDDEVDGLLRDTVVLVDPMLNPDGLARFSGWVNGHKGAVPVADAEHREHREGWPGSRGNHYWYDLNRDWLLAVHPESRARLATYHAWKPHVVVDAHEMGTASTFFFQPGVPSRTHPLTPPRNQELTAALATFHARALDARGVLYFSEETFDDFYYGKGSTYPDVNGGIGVLFEQASSRGHLQRNAWGELSFADTIGNQLATALSTLDGAAALRDELLAFQAGFVADAREAAAQAEAGGWVFGDAADPERGRMLVELLRRHDVAVHALAARLEKRQQVFEPGSAWIVPSDQPAHRLATALFEQRTEFEDDVFYDVSTWTLPSAFDLPWAELPRAGFDAGWLGDAVADAPRRQAGRRGRASTPPVGWAFAWNTVHAPAALSRLLAAGVRAQVATRPLTVVTSEGEVALAEGAILVPGGVQELPRHRVEALLDGIAAEDSVLVHALASGLTPHGIDLGSPSAPPLTAPKPALVVGGGVSSTRAGEIWHVLDTRLHLPLVLLDASRVGRADLSVYTHLLLVDGSPRAFDDDALAQLCAWVRAGGVLVASGEAASWAETRVLGRQRTEDSKAAAQAEAEAASAAADAPLGSMTPRPSYADASLRAAKERIAGALFEARLDRTHPLGFGFSDDRLPLFRTSTAVLSLDPEELANVAVYTEQPLLSGYASRENVGRVAGTVAAAASRLGDGVVVRFADDVLFRGIFWGSQRLLANALFFGSTIEKTGRGDEGAGEH